MALVCDLKSSDVDPHAGTEPDNPDLEDGEIEDDDEDEAPADEPPEVQGVAPAAAPILPAAVPADAGALFAPDKDKKRHSERKGEKHLTEAEKCVRMLHKMERAERERRERDRRREQLAGNCIYDWAGNVEKAIANVLKKDRHSASAEEEEDEEKKRGRKRKKKERDRKKKHRKVESPPKTEEIDEDEMLNIRGASPENKPKENSPFPEAEPTYESFDSEYDSEPYQHRQNKRAFDRKTRNRNRDARRDRKNFREKNRKKEAEQNRPQLQDANSICMFYMQGKCHKGDECPYSHDALPPMKLELCKFYLMDCCAKRDKCLYMHSEFPCKYYHTGLRCFAKDKCKFAHGKPLSDSLKQVLLKHLETAPKEILGDFPRLSREGAQQMVNQMQKQLECQYGIKTTPSANAQGEKTGIPSLFDITVPVPPELMQQQQQQNQQQGPGSAPSATADNEGDGKQKLNPDIKSEKKVRHTRWNDEPTAPIAPPLLNPAFTGNIAPVFSGLTLQDQQKIHEYQLSYQMKGFYSEQDQDMRINSNGDVDMRALPQMAPKPDDQLHNFTNQYLQDAGLTSTSTEPKMDVDIRNITSDTNLTIVEDASSKLNQTTSSNGSVKRDFDPASDSSLTIDEKADSGSELPSNLPKKQRELFLRIQAQQKENIPENQHSNADEQNLKDDDWYSSDDDNDPLSKMVIHLEDEQDENEQDDKTKKSPDRILSPPTIKPVEVIDKLGDLSKIDISAEVTKLLTSIKTNTQTPSTSTSSQESKKSRDPRQAKLLDAEITSPVINSDPRAKAAPRAERRESRETRMSIYEQGIINPEEKLSMLEHGRVVEAQKGDVDLRGLDSLPKDLDMRPHYGDTDLRQGGRQDVDLRQMGLPFKAIQNYTPATEIDASIASHTAIAYKIHVVDIPRPDYTGLKLSAQDAQVAGDPRLRKIFRLPSTDEKDSPMSPKAQSPPKPARQDPRRRPQHQDPEPQKTDTSSLSYSQQLQLLQNSAFYQSLTSNQKLMLNQEIASKGDQSAPHDPILTGILSSLELIPSGANSNGCAMNILANVNSMGPNMNPIMGMPHPNMNLPMGPNLGPGLLGAAPPIPMGPNVPQNDFQINFDPRNGGLLGPAPFQNFPDNQNFQNYDEFYPNNEECNFPGGNNNNFNNSRNDNRNFRGDRNMQNNNRRGRSWNNRHNNSRNFNRNNNRNRTNRSYTPP